MRLLATAGEYVNKVALDFMNIHDKEVTNPILLALIRLTVELQCVLNEEGPGFEDRQKVLVDALRGAQDTVNNTFTTGEGLK